LAVGAHHVGVIPVENREYLKTTVLEGQLRAENSLS
jgi:hypothetical protein